MKRCNVCQQFQALINFCKRTRSLDGHDWECKKCHNLRGKGYYQRNRNQVRKQQAAAYQQNLEKERNRSKEKYQNNTLYYHVKSANRRALKLNRTPKWLTSQQKAEIKEWYNAARTLSRECGRPFHVDHIVPIKGKNVSGLHVPWNLQILPAEENLKKGNRD